MQNKIEIQKNIGASPSGKAAGFGPAISEVRILPPQPINSLKGEFFVGKTKIHKSRNEDSLSTTQIIFFYIYLRRFGVVLRLFFRRSLPNSSNSRNCRNYDAFPQQIPLRRCSLPYFYEAMCHRY